VLADIAAAKIRAPVGSPPLECVLQTAFLDQPAANPRRKLRLVDPQVARPLLNIGRAESVLWAAFNISVGRVLTIFIDSKFTRNFDLQALPVCMQSLHR